MIFLRKSLLLVAALFCCWGTAMADLNLSAGNTAYVPGMTQTLTIDVTVASTNIEYADYFDFTFPAGWMVTADAVGPAAGYGGCGGNSGDIVIQDPAMPNVISIGRPDGIPGGGSGCGAYANGTYSFSFTVTPDGMMDETITITGFGDGFNEPAPTVQTLTITATALVCDLTDVPAPVNVSADADMCGADVVLANPTASMSCQGSVALIDEGFDDGVQPAGWSVDDGTGTPATGYSGQTSDGGTVADGTVQFDSQDVDGGADNPDFDGNRLEITDRGAPDNAGLGYVVTNTIDLTAVAPGAITLSYDATNQAFAADGQMLVDVWDGTMWVNIQTVTADQTDASNSVDVSGFANADFAVRFGYDDEGRNGGTPAWAAGFDNIQLIAPSAPIVLNDFNGTDDASGFFPVGTTVVTFSVTDPSGNATTAQTTVTVTDDQAPEIVITGLDDGLDGDDDNIDGDVTFQLGPGECSVTVPFAVALVDNCEENPVMITQNSSAIISNGVGCGTTDLTHLRIFDLDGEFGVTRPLQIDSVDVGINIATGGVGATLNIYTLAPGDDFVSANLNLVTTSTVVLPNLDSEIYTFPVNLTVDPTNDLVVELAVDAPDPTQFVGGYTAGGTGISYVNGPCAGLTDPTDISTLIAGFDDQFYIQVNGVEGQSQLAQTDATGFLPGDMFPIGTTVLTFEGQDASGNTAPTRTVTINVIEFAPSTTALACNDLVNVSLDDDCSVEITADFIVEGDSDIGCLEFFDVDILDATGASMGNIATADMIGEGPFVVRVTNPATGNMCWGEIVVEDKIAPMVVDCPPVTELPCGIDVDNVGTFGANRRVAVTPATPIPNVGTVIVDIPVSGIQAGATVNDLDVDLDLNHTWVADLDIFLISPQGTSVELFTDVCGADDNVNVTLDDDAPLSVNDLDCGPLTGIGQPEGMLSDFNGEPINGTWQLQITDDTGGDSGLVNEIGLNFRFIQSGIDAPVFADNCDANLDITFVQSQVEGSCDADFIRQVQRVYTATDEAGNTATCVQTINLVRPTLDDIDPLPGFTGLDNGIDLPAFGCDSGFTPDNLPPTSLTGLPTISGFPIVNNGPCMISVAQLDDVVIPVCDATFTILRTFVIVDMCTATSIEVGQIIKIGDTEGPAITCPADVVTIPAVGFNFTPGAPHLQCLGNIVVPPLAVGADNCSGIDPTSSTTELYAFDGMDTVLIASVTGLGGVFDDIDLIDDDPTTEGVNYLVRSVVGDLCGNFSECSYLINVVDRTNPQVICDEITTVTLTNAPNGCTTVPAEVLDDGSYDNCGQVVFRLAKMDDGNPFLTQNFGRWYYPDLDFCCDDVSSDDDGDGELDGQQVILLVQDDDVDDAIIDFQNTNPAFGSFRTPGYGFVAGRTDGLFVGAFQGPEELDVNFESCMVEVITEDKSLVNLTCPTFAPINCLDFDAIAVQLDATDPDDNAGRQAILESFGFASPLGFGAVCGQSDDSQISFSLDNCGTGTITRTFTTTGANMATASISCDIPISNVPTFRVQFPGDVDEICVDGTIVDPTDTDLLDSLYGVPTFLDDGCNMLSYSQEVELFENFGSGCYKIVRTFTAINMCAATAPFTDINGFNGGQVYIDADDADNLFAGAQIGSDAVIRYAQVIEVDDSDAPIITDVPALEGCIISPTATGNACALDLLIPAPTATDCSAELEIGFLLQTQGTPGVLVAAGTFTGASTTIADVAPGDYTVIYNVSDRCGNSTVTAQDVEVRDCKKPSPVCMNGIVVELMQTGMISVDVTQIDLGSFDNCPGALTLSFAPFGTPGYPVTTATYDCSQVGDNPISLYVRDAAGNEDFCTTFVRVQDNMFACAGGDPLVGGLIATEMDEPVEDVTVEISDINSTVATTDMGNYSFDVPAGNDITIVPTKNNDAADNGVSTLDIVAINKHVLGLQLLNSPYKRIAADANNSGSISALDIIAIRRVILHLDNEFQNVGNWRFVDSDYAFTTNVPENEDFPEVISINNLNDDEMDADFVAVKVGDVNGTAQTSSIADHNTEDRSAGTYVLNVAERAFKAGETFTVAFDSETANVLGYQFTLNTAGLELTDFIGGVATEENFGLSLDDATAITASWNGQAMTGTQFALTFTATKAGKLSEVLSIGSRYTSAEAYNSNGAMNVSLDFTGSIEAAEFALLQNVPNPFSGTTTIGFVLPEAGAATLTVTDLSGKRLQVIEGDYAKGYNEVQVRTDVTGVLHYTLQTAEHTATRKMVVTK